MRSADPLFCLLFTVASTVQGDQKSFTKMPTEGNITKPLSEFRQQTRSEILQADVKVQKEESNFEEEKEDDGIYWNEKEFAIFGHAENEAEKEVAAKTEAEKNLEKRKLAMGLAILSDGPDGGGAVEQQKINAGKDRMNSAESSIVANWRGKISLPEDVVIKPKAAMGLRKMSGASVRTTMGSEKAEDEDEVGHLFHSLFTPVHHDNWNRLHPRGNTRSFSVCMCVLWHFSKDCVFIQF